jgi:hypothetical protein
METSQRSNNDVLLTPREALREKMIIPAGSEVKIYLNGLFKMGYKLSSQHYRVMEIRFDFEDK